MNTRKISFFIASIIVSLVFTLHPLFAAKTHKSFPLNQKRALDEWQEKIFQRKVLYTINDTTADGYLVAASDKACSGLFYEVDFDVRKYPFISWEWNATTFPTKKSAPVSKEGWIEKDDYAARVYVIFPSWNFLRTRSIEYIWDESLPEGTVLTSPYFKNIKLIVAESGRQQEAQWVFEERNIAQDYQTAFGKKPKQNVGAIALMTDADNTISTAEAFYKNIKVGYEYAQKKK